MLRIEHLSKTYGVIMVVNDFYLYIEHGEI